VEKDFGIKPEKILLIGDSAGGNLAIALTLWCIKIGYRKPDVIFPCYPALNLDLEQVTPSILNSLEDPILNVGFLKICLDSYLPELNTWMNPITNPFLSPLVANDEVIVLIPNVKLK
jgi:hormone-sensitive lipase